MPPPIKSALTYARYGDRYGEFLANVRLRVSPQALLKPVTLSRGSRTASARVVRGPAFAEDVGEQKQRDDRYDAVA